MHKQENPCANSKQYNQLNHHHPHMERLQLLNESLMALLEVSAWWPTPGDVCSVW